jgi:hypothetical protein
VDEQDRPVEITYVGMSRVTVDDAGFRHISENVDRQVLKSMREMTGSRGPDQQW